MVNIISAIIIIIIIIGLTIDRYRSPPINIEDIGAVAFRLPSLEGDHLINTDIKIEGSTIFVYLSRSRDGWPFKIENHSGYQVSFSQVVSRFAFVICFIRTCYSLGPKAS